MSTILFPAADRQLPYAPEAEIAVLGGMLIDADAAAAALELVDESMFYREANRRVFWAMKACAERGMTVEPVSVSEQLKATDELDSIGGMAYLVELLDSVATAANLPYHAKLVQERATQRRMIEAASQVIRDCYELGERTVAEVVDEAQRRVNEVATGAAEGGLTWIKRDLYSAFEDIERYQEAKGGLTGTPTGFPDLDDKTGGWQRGDFVLVAARPSMGKTALLVSHTLHAAIVGQVPVAFFSLEMRKGQIVQRMLCHEALVDLMALRTGRLADDDYVRLTQAAGHLNTAPIYTDDRSSPTVAQIRAATRKLQAEVPALALVVVDYLQFIRAAGGENRQNEVSAISRELKAMAKDLNVCVLAASQLSRAPEGRTDHRPQLSDLRDSGSLEQDADVVLMLHRPDKYMRPADAEEQGITNQAELIIAKQRNGPTGSVDLYFRAASTRFESFTRHEAPRPVRNDTSSGWYERDVA